MKQTLRKLYEHYATPVTPAEQALLDRLSDNLSTRPPEVKRGKA